jgi:hypothetical protein
MSNYEKRKFDQLRRIVRANLRREVKLSAKLCQVQVLNQASGKAAEARGR